MSMNHTGALGLDSSWQAVVVSDFGGDGKADMMMRQNGGDWHWLFEMNGSTVINSNGIGKLGLDSSWDIIGHR